MGQRKGSKFISHLQQASQQRNVFIKKKKNEKEERNVSFLSFCCIIISIFIEIFFRAAHKFSSIVYESAICSHFDCTFFPYPKRWRERSLHFHLLDEESCFGKRWWVFPSLHVEQSSIHDRCPTWEATQKTIQGNMRSCGAVDEI